MKRFLLGDTPVNLLYYSPNWEETVDCAFTILSGAEKSLTGKEDRSPLSASLRTAMEFSILITRDEYSEFRNALKGLANEAVICPFWPATSGYAETDKSGIGGGLWIVWEPGWADGEFAVYTDGGTPSITPSSEALKAPLLWGRFDEDPQPEAVTDEVAQCDIVFIDNSQNDFALTVDAQDVEYGPQINGSAQKMFPLLPNWAGGLEAGEAKYTIVKDEVGLGRTTADTYYDQDGVRATEQEFMCDGWSSVKKMLRFFYEAAGAVGRFWLPLAVAGCRLTGDVAEVPVTNSSDAVPTGLQGEVVWEDSGLFENGEKVYYDPTDTWAYWNDGSAWIVTVKADVGGTPTNYFKMIG